MEEAICGTGDFDIQVLQKTFPFHFRFSFPFPSYRQLFIPRIIKLRPIR